MRNDFESNYLAHWGIKKGEKAKNHKYFERVEKNGKYIYFYTQAEYERWLHGAKPKVEGAKNKAKSAISSLKNRFSLTKSNLTNAINKGRSAAYNLASRSSVALTKSNVNSVINRGTSAINSILGKASSQAAGTVNSIQKQAKNTVQNVKKQVKAVTPKLQQKAKSIANNVERTLKKAGKDTQKAVQKYVSKGEQTINSVLSKAGNIKMSKTKNVGNVGVAIIASILASAVVAAVSVGVAKLVKYIKDKTQKPQTVPDEEWHTPEEPKKPQDKQENNSQESEESRNNDGFSSDASDSHKEDLDEHSDIPAKEEVMSRDEDMAAINAEGNEIPPELFEEIDKLVDDYYNLAEKYNQTGDERYLEEMDKIYDKYLDATEYYEGYLSNCANCTLTYDLRRRGYDVDAPWNVYGTYTDTIYNWYQMDPEKDVDYWRADDGDRFSKQEAKELVDYLNNQYPEGAYGHFLTTWADGGGHDCVWSKEDGKIIIRDCQTNEIVDPEEYILRSYDIEYFRADDKELSDTAYNLANAEVTNDNGTNITEDKSDIDWLYNRQKKGAK